MLKWFRKKKEPEEKKEPQKGLFARLKERLSKTRQSFTSKLDRLMLGKKEIDEEVLEELEEILIMADLGVKATQDLIQQLTKKVSRKEINNLEQLKQHLKEEMLSLLSFETPPLNVDSSKPFVFMVVGVNGVGKTTTIAKLAHYYKEQGKNVLLIAADTFRAAAIEQLEIWAERVGVDIYKQKSGADPAAVVFDGLQMAQKRNMDIVLIDTAGRLHTKVNLMEELKKVKRVMKKVIPDAPHEILLILDATTGQNAISQAKLFHEALNITGLILAKLDGTAKGGIVISICHEFKIPLRFIGIGEEITALRPFEPKEFIEALF
ncbi:MAG TPA: signal recognition particle-docking protein FtsY [Candidatus Desulfofervidus auxilii]|uniref:Signal recognition particle receptor FtsY n=1 Tax=Desulfofervidus auxilii TaxID=1621989 RepID=A0A7C0U3P6_DESA2|nr:signal recognition particle-docking protein FtsY [Candidatus Desulfofervidus auxilii]